MVYEDKGCRVSKKMNIKIYYILETVLLIYNNEYNTERRIETLKQISYYDRDIHMRKVNKNSTVQNTKMVTEEWKEEENIKEIMKFKYY